MATFYSYIAPSEISSGHDPVRVLLTALTRASLVACRSYDPNRASFWAKSDVSSVEPQLVTITNQKTGEDEAVSVCTMDTQA